MRKMHNLRKLLNLNFLKYTNKTFSIGKKDLPALYCRTDVYPDFLALYSEPGLYFKTDKTAVCFYEYDSEFDGIHGLYNAIKYDDKELLKFFKARFENVKFFISPDCSLLGDVQKVVNEERIFASRVDALWFIHELGAVVMPDISFPNEEYSEYTLDGLEKCETVAISTKGHMNSKKERKWLYEHIRIAVDKLPRLKAIVVYDGCGNDKNLEKVFSYAKAKNIKIIVPENTLKNCNRKPKKKKVVN